MDLKIDLRINDTPVKLGETIDGATLDRADFRKAGLLRRVIDRLPAGLQRFEAQDCTLSCFDDKIQFYPCTHGYLTPDRQWRTQAFLFTRDDQLLKLLFKIVDGQYAAASFMERFHEECENRLGQPEEADEFFASWRRRNMLITKVLYPDLKNADVSIELADELC